jgi:hypothetical protein
VPVNTTAADLKHNVSVEILQKSPDHNLEITHDDNLGFNNYVPSPVSLSCSLTIYSISSSSFTISRRGSFISSELNSPTFHSFSPFHSHHVLTEGLFGLICPARNNGKGFALSGISKLPTRSQIFFLAAAETGKKTIILPKFFEILSRLLGRNWNSPGRTLINSPHNKFL